MNEIDTMFRDYFDKIIEKSYLYKFLETSGALAMLMVDLPDAFHDVDPINI